MTRDLFRLFDQSLTDASGGSSVQSLQDMSVDESEQDLIVRRAGSLIETQLKVDYSDFSNHVFFNSALDYFNITGEKILNEYPYGGTRAELEAFKDGLDGYQRHVLSRWPSRLGHLRFNPSVSASFVQIDDVGREQGLTKTSLLSPGTGSISVEAWINSGRYLTGSDEVSVILQKYDTAGGQKGYTLFLSGSRVVFRVASGSFSSEVTAPMDIGVDRYVLGVLDRSVGSGTLSIYTGSILSEPVAVSNAQLMFGGPLFIGSSSLLIGSGTIAGKSTIPFSGAIDDVRVWRVPLSIGHVTSSYNRKAYARGSLVGLWRFNETGSSGLLGLDSVVLDHSGHGLNGRIRNYWPGIRGSGSLFFETPDPILDVRTPEVLSYIAEWQTSGSVYDRNNNSKITDLVPSAYLETDSDQDADLVRNFLYVLARHYDKLKLYIQHLQYVLRTNYTDFNQVPDAQLEEMARFFGLDLPGGFANSTAIQYFLGRDILDGNLSNEELDERLYEIKAKFWRRLLNNLSYIYKTKGTRESVQSLMRVYGVNEGFVRLKEFGFVTRNRLEAQRIRGEKSDWALGFGSGSLSGSVRTSYPISFEDSSGSVVQSFQFSPADQPFPNSPIGLAQSMGDPLALATHIFPFQESFGTWTVTDVVTGLTGTHIAAGVPRSFMGSTASIYSSGSWTWKRAIEHQYFTPQIRAGDNTVFSQFGTGSFAIFLVERSYDRTSQTGMIGKRDTVTNRGFWIERLTPALYQAGIANGSTTFIATAPCIAMCPVVHLLVVDRTAGQLRYYTQHSSATTNITSTASIDAPTATFWFDGSRTNVFSTWGQRIYLAVFTGSYAERLNKSHVDSFWRAGKDASFSPPYNYSRSGHVSCRVFDDKDEHGDLVTHFQGALIDTSTADGSTAVALSLPKGDGELGMLVNGTVRNYICPSIYFKDWNNVDIYNPLPKWHPAVGNLTASVIAPDRTYSAQSITELAHNAYIEHTSSFIPASTSSICASIWMRRPPGTTAHTSTLEVLTTGGLVIKNEHFPVSDKWDRKWVGVDLTSHSGYVPGSRVLMRIYPGQSGSSYNPSQQRTLHIWGAQINDGYEPLPFVMTTGSTNGHWYPADGRYQSISPSIAFVEGVPGTFVDGARGEVKATWSVLTTTGSLADRVVIDLTENGTNFDRRSVKLSGALGKVVADLYGSDGVHSYLTSSISLSEAINGKELSLRWNIQKLSESAYADFLTHESDRDLLTSSFDGSTSRVNRVWFGQSSGSNFLFGTINNIEFLDAPTVSGALQPDFKIDGDFTAEVQVRFPTVRSRDIVPTKLSGVVFAFGNKNNMNDRVMLWYERESLSSHTGSLFISSSAGIVGSVPQLSIFDDRWTNIALMRRDLTGSIHILRSDHGNVSHLLNAIDLEDLTFNRFSVGSTGTFPSEMWAREARLWTSALTDSELNDHVLHYESYGRESSKDIKNDLVLYWRMNEGVHADASGTIEVVDHSLNDRIGEGVGFGSGSFPYRKFLTEYHYIGSPDFGWTQKKVRVFDGSRVSRQERPIDSRLLSLEFNMVDQLNEDISRMASSFEEMNDAIGMPNTVYDGYRGLTAMRREYCRRLTDRLNFRVFVDMLDFFDRSFVEAIRKMVPARAVFIGDEVVVESHMLERPRHEYAYRPLREVQFFIEGVIQMIKR